jgi:hypothetical protein
MEMTYISQPPSKWTFEQPKLKKWTESWCQGNVLNLFAGKIKLNVDEIRVDLSNEFQPDYCMDAYEFVTTWDKFYFDTIIFDPPYNLRKAREKYGTEGKYIGIDTKIKNKLSGILNPGGLILTYGFNSVGMSKSRGFEKIAICLVCHNGNHNDTIALVERKII